jgi:hypothetical protein
MIGNISEMVRHSCGRNGFSAMARIALSRTKLVINSLILLWFHLTIIFNHLIQQRCDDGLTR